MAGLAGLRRQAALQVPCFDCVFLAVAIQLYSCMSFVEMCWQQPPPLLVPALVHVRVLLCSEPDWVPAVCYVCALCGKYFVLPVALFRGRPCCCFANSTGEKAGRRGSCCPSLLHRGGRASLAAAVLILPARRQAGRAVDSRIPPARRRVGLAVAVLIPRARSQTGLAAAVLIPPAKRRAGLTLPAAVIASTARGRASLAAAVPIPPARRRARLAATYCSGSLLPPLRAGKPGSCCSNSTGDEAGNCCSNSTGEEAGKPGSSLLLCPPAGRQAK